MNIYEQNKTVPYCLLDEYPRIKKYSETTYLVKTLHIIPDKRIYTNNKFIT